MYMYISPMLCLMHISTVLNVYFTFSGADQIYYTAVQELADCLTKQGRIMLENVQLDSYRFKTQNLVLSLHAITVWHEMCLVYVIKAVQSMIYMYCIKHLTEFNICYYLQIYFKSDIKNDIFNLSTEVNIKTFKIINNKMSSFYYFLPKITLSEKL